MFHVLVDSKNFAVSEDSLLANLGLTQPVTFFACSPFVYLAIPQSENSPFIAVRFTPKTDRDKHYMIVRIMKLKDSESEFQVSCQGPSDAEQTRIKSLFIWRTEKSRLSVFKNAQEFYYKIIVCPNRFAFDYKEKSVLYPERFRK